MIREPRGYPIDGVNCMPSPWHRRSLAVAVMLGGCTIPEASLGVLDETGGSESESTVGDGRESTAGGGAASRLPCRSAALLDDLEDGDGVIRVQSADPRRGAWYTYNDGTGGTQTPKAGTSVRPVKDGERGSSFVVRTFGSGYTLWGAGIGFDLDNPGCPEDGEPCDGNDEREPYNANMWGGIEFFARSNDERFTNDVEIKVLTVAVTPVGEGGTCDGSACYDYHHWDVRLSTEWRPFRLLFESDDFVQEGWGQEFGFDAGQVLGIQWQVKPGTFDVSIDDVCFF